MPDESSRPNNSVRDLAVVVVLAVVVFLLSAAFDIFNKVILWMYRHDTWQLDELFTVSLFLAVALSLYAWRRHRELISQIRRREKAEAEKAELLPKLQSALAEVHSLKKLVPMCTSCRKVRNEDGTWDHLELYIETHLVARIDEGVCPDCARRLYGNGTHAHRTE